MEKPTRKSRGTVPLNSYSIGLSPFLFFHFVCVIAPTLCIYTLFWLLVLLSSAWPYCLSLYSTFACLYPDCLSLYSSSSCRNPDCLSFHPFLCLSLFWLPVLIHLVFRLLSLLPVVYYFLQTVILSLLKGAQVWDFDVLDFNDFFIMKSI
jgi:hypothetical protein